MTIEFSQETLDEIVSEAVSDALNFQGGEREPLGSPKQHYYKRLYIRLRDYSGRDSNGIFSPHDATSKEGCAQMWLDALNDFWILLSQNGLDWDAARDSGLEHLRSRCCMKDGIKAVTENSLDRAEDFFRQAVADTEMREAPQFLGYVRLELGKYGEALEAFQRQLELPGILDLPPRLGVCLATLYAGDAEGAARLAKSMSQDLHRYVYPAEVLKQETDLYRGQTSPVPQYRSSPNHDYWKDQLYSRILLAAESRLN